MEHTREQLEAYIQQSEARLKNTASAWMKTEVRKGIELAKVELAKLDRHAVQNQIDTVFFPSN